MSSDVVLSSALRSNLLSLQNTQRNIDATQLRLATGLKVNSALDNPQNFFAGQSLNNRASDLNRLLDGISQSIRTVEEADNGITALTRLVEQAESVALEALSEIRSAEGFARVRGTEVLTDSTDLVTDSGGVIAAGVSDQFTISFTDADGATVTSADITVDAGDTVFNIVAEINSDATIQDSVRAGIDSAGRLTLESLDEGGLISIGEGTNSLTAAGFSFLGLDNVVGSRDNDAGAFAQGGTIVAGTTVRSDAAANRAANGLFEASQLLSAENDANGADFLTSDASDANIVLTIDGTRTDIGQITGTDTVQDVLDRVNNADLDVTASFDTDTGRIELEFGDTVGQAEVEFVDNAGGSEINFGLGSGISDVTLTGAGDAVSEIFTFAGTSADLDQFQDDFNEIRNQIDGIVEDAQYRGVNLLGGDNLTTFFNEDRDNTLVTEGVTFDALGLGVAEADFTDVASVQLSIDSVRTALESVRNFGSSIANDLSIIQTRRDFTEQTINTLESGADDLTVADQNEEGANLLALQTRQQLGVTSLSLASQSQQSVLRLF